MLVTCNWSALRRDFWISAKGSQVIEVIQLLLARAFKEASQSQVKSHKSMQTWAVGLP